ncbi:Lpg1974 family pore-forming outer membrane protein [Legionella sp. km772]|uniref:Lpg1974 family pore-forming outer membrane protein n=1 Tax=Legionella sp. km772 TaxID=2498111 RepID=UPI000F8F6874|nr:Lpg1974 family pore-forming outer membrane protein [Legionella sp. km772]RUR08441.1 hypothetical protein ELY15_10855 [Legionella sp. km772]
MRLSKLTLVITLVGSGFASAGTMGPICSPGNVTLPCAQTAWGVHANALYLQSSYSGALGYSGFVSPISFSATDYVHNDPNWSWGFEIGASYYFNTGNDFSVDWFHLISPTTTNTANYIFGVPFAQRSYDTTMSIIKPNWDAVNIQLGQLVNVNVLKTLRFYGGAQYARIATSMTNTGTAFSFPTDYDIEDMQFSGFGPRLGLDMAYDLIPNFDAYAKVGTGVLVGSSKTNSTRGNLIDPNPFVIYANRTQVVPEVDLKLGLQYDFALNENHIIADAGYMWVNYFSPLARINYNFNNLETANYSLDGVYFGMKWVSSV